MKFSKICLSLLFLINFTSYLDSKISANKIKDLVNVLNPDYEYLSPVHGAMLWESDYVKNMYSFAPESDTKKLIKEMFYLQPDGTTFGLTYNPLKISAYFNAKTITKIISLIVKIEQNIISETELKTNLSTIFKNLVFEEKSLKKSVQDDIKNGINKEIQYLEQQLKPLEEIDKLRKQIDRAKKSQKLIFEKQLNKKLKEINLTKDLMASTKQKFKNKINSKKQNLKDTNWQQKILSNTIEDLITFICNSFKEEKQIYPERHTLFIFLAGLWKISENKQTFLNYFLSLQNELGNKFNLFKQDYNLTEKENQTKFLESAYTFENYTNFSKQQLDINEYEKLCFLSLVFSVYESILPTNIDFKEKVIYKNHRFSDCGETSLLNFFNAVLYDSKTQSFDISILEKLGATKNLIDFYKSHATPEQMVDNIQLHNDWAIAVSELPNVKYDSEICNIRPGLQNKGIENIFKVLENLFPKLVEEKDKESSILETLVKTIQSTEINIKIDMPNKDNPEKQIIKIKIKKFGKSVKLNWMFQVGHFVIEFPAIESLLKHIYSDTIQKKLLTPNIVPYIFIKYLTLARFNDIDNKSVINQDDWVIYSFLIRKSNSKNILAMMKEISEDSFPMFNEFLQKIDPNAIKNLLNSLYAKLPIDDENIQKEAIKYLGQKLKIEEYKNNITDKVKQFLANNIIQYNQLENFSYLAEILPKLSSKSSANQTKGDIIRNILLQIRNNKDINTDNFEILYEKIKLILNKTKSEAAITDIIVNFLSLFCYWSFDYRDADVKLADKKLFTFFYDWIKKSLPKIKKYKQVEYLFFNIKDIDPEIVNPEFLKTIYNWTKQTIPTISPANKTTITEKQFFLLIKQLLLLAKIKDQEVIDTIYNWVEKNLPLFTDKTDQTKIFNLVFNLFQPEKINGKILDTIEKWISKNISQLKDANLNKKFKKWQKKIQKGNESKKEEVEAEHAESESESSSSSSSSSSEISSSTSKIESSIESDEYFSAEDAEEEKPTELGQ